MSRACAPKDPETDSIIKAYIRLDPTSGSILAEELGIEIVEDQKQSETEELKHLRLEVVNKYKEYDAQGLDYDLEIYDRQERPA